jgi:hypothetical protein
VETVAVLILCGAVSSAQNGPPALAGADRDPFVSHPLDRPPSRAMPRNTSATSAADVKRSREDLARLIALTAEVRKAMEGDAQNTIDVRMPQRLEEIEKIAKRMRKRILQ